MPSTKKTVHWEDDVPRTPSPTPSNGSVASSTGPITPETIVQPLPPVQIQYPPYQYGAYLTPHNPYVQKSHRHIPSPVSPAKTNVHYVLSVDAHAHPSTQPFRWTMYTHPNDLDAQVSSPSRSPSTYPIPQATLALPATSPPMKKLEITCALLPFHMVVSASKLFGQDYLTVGDVLAALYSQLRTQISQDEYNRVGGGRPDVQQKVNGTFFARLHTIRDGETREKERQHGIRRSDLLMDSQVFAGLEMRSNHTAVLHVKPFSH